MSTDREARIDRMLDREDIRECLHRYTRGIDRHDTELTMSAFHEDALDTHGAFEGGRADVAAWANGSHEQHTVAHQHYITNITIDLDGDVAHTETYYLIVLHRTDGFGSDVLGGRYVDRLERRDGDWRIARRIVSMDWTAESRIGRLAIQRILASYQPCRWDPSDVSYQRPLSDASHQVPIDLDGIPR